MLYDIVNDNIQILLDKNLYKLEDIINANNSIADKCSMKIDENDKAYIVNIVSDIVPEEITKIFFYKLSDFITRRNLLEENKYIRDLIVENAFKPIENLKDKLNG